MKPASSPTADLHLRRSTLWGIGLILAAAVCFSTMDNTLRHTGRLVPVLLILWVRYGIQAVLMTAWLALSPSGRFRTGHPKFQLARGALLLATSAMSFWGVQFMPVAEFTAINMLTPVLVTLLAGWLLHERVSRLRWLLVIGAFIGALIVMRPGSGVFGWAVLFPLAGAVTYACFQVLTSKLSALEDPTTTHFYTGCVGVLLLTPLLLGSGLDVTATLAHAAPSTLALLVLIGLLGSTGHLLLIFALGRAPASTLMPIMYAQIGMAAFIGWLMFGHLPDGWAWVGMAVIAVCGGTSAWLNLRPRSPMGR